MSDAGGRADRSYLLDSSGAAAPPRDNGELVFAAPWESRAFGVALALHDAGRIEWEDFRQTLIAEIGLELLRVLAALAGAGGLRSGPGRRR